MLTLLFTLFRDLKINTNVLRNLLEKESGWQQSSLPSNVLERPHFFLMHHPTKLIVNVDAAYKVHHLERGVNAMMCMFQHSHIGLAKIFSLGDSIEYKNSFKIPW